MKTNPEFLELHTPFQRKISVAATVLWFFIGALVAMHGQEPASVTIPQFKTGVGAPMNTGPSFSTTTASDAPSATVPQFKTPPAAAPTDDLPVSSPLLAANDVPIPAASSPVSPGSFSSTPPPAPAPVSVAPTSAPAIVAPASAPATTTVEVPPASDTALFAKPPEEKAKPSQNVTINLINRLVQRGLLSKDDADELIKQAEDDVVVARKQSVQDAVAAAQAVSPEPASDDAVRVTYVPEVVRNQIRDEIKQEVMTRAKNENWAAPGAFPEWTSRFRFFGDIRTRFEGDFYPSGNDNTGAFPNFNAINTGAPFDVTGNTFSPQYNVDQNRDRFRLRARLGTEVDLGENFTAGIRLATGENNSPVTANQSLGGASNGQGGNFSKYAIWLDRAFIKYEAGGNGRDLSVMVGRFDNPFFTTSSIMWADDIGFDGLAFRGKYEIVPGVTPFLVAGAFPVFNTDFNFSTNQPAKFESEDKYLYAAQLGIDWKMTKDFSAKVAAAYYDFQNIEGKLSDPYTPLTAADQGNTDDSRPAFAQNGNTYMALRNIVPTAQNNFGGINQFQYFGLASKFREFALTGRLDYGRYDPFHIALSGEFVTNTAFDRGDIESKAVNNRGASGSYAGGNNAWIVNFKVGSAALEKRWDWNLGVNYRYVESDSLVDGFADSDFGAPLSGTNLKGYTAYGALALSPRVWLYLRWMSANSIDGPPFKNDLIQFDLNTKF